MNPNNNADFKCPSIKPYPLNKVILIKFLDQFFFQVI